MELITRATAAEVARREFQVALVPIGSFEQHGSHLPLTTDTAISSLIAARLADTYDALLLPPIAFSCSHEHEGLPGLAGTVSISASTLIQIIDDIRLSLARSGIDKLVLVNGHGGNYVLSNIVQQANVASRRVVLFPTRDDWNTARRQANLATSGHDDMHGGELETSILLYGHPELVRADYDTADHEARHRPHLLVTGMAGYTESGIIGRPSLATASKGRAVVDSLVAAFAEHLKILNP